MPICENCGKEHDGTFGSGRFCCRSCANTHHPSEETKNKIRESTYKYLLKSTGQDENGVYLNKRQRQRLETEKKNLEYIDDVLNSSDRKFLEHPTIDFGKKYVITVYGDIISVSTKKCMKQAFKEYDDKYIRVVLTDVDNKQHLLTVHRLVAYNFIPNPDNLPLINHKDENPSNNNVDNLEWCTYQYNATYNDVHIKRGLKVSQRIRENGGSWNKGLKKDKNGKYIR